MTPDQHTFLELFSGGGMARGGLGTGWRCLLSCDNDHAKATTYRRNWGASELVVDDIRELRADQVTERPDLAWVSSPCQDVSAAGSRGGLDGGRSGALWPALDFIKQITARGNSPRLVVIENVAGMASSRGGDDLVAVAQTLAATGYRVGALVIDAKSFLPQSRPRLFVIAVDEGVAVSPGLTSGGPVRPWHPAALHAVAAKCQPWVWWAPPTPTPRKADLADMLEDDALQWHTTSETTSLLALMSKRDVDRLKETRRAGGVVGTLTRRTRPAAGGNEQRAELRIDGAASCLRTPGGGSSSQALIVADKKSIRTRSLTPRECARLMGLPDDYRLPRKREDALRLVGDGVVVPVVRFLASSLLEPLLAAPTATDVKPRRPGIKGGTRATTLYLLPQELQRLRRLAIDLDVSLHDLMLRGLDRVLFEHGQRPLERYKQG